MVTLFDLKNEAKPPKIFDLCDTKYWIDIFHTNYDTQIIKVEPWLIEASTISQQTGTFSKLYQDYLDNNDNIYFTPCFIRCENVSLKYGQHEAGPYDNIKQVIESIVTSIPTHTPLHHDTKEIKLYMLPWINMDMSKEFRVFVYNNNIVAISQQDICIVYKDLEHNIEKYVEIIISYFNTNVKNEIKS